MFGLSLNIVSFRKHRKGWILPGKLRKRDIVRGRDQQAEGNIGCRKPLTTRRDATSKEGLGYGCVDAGTAMTSRPNWASREGSASMGNTAEARVPGCDDCSASTRLANALVVT
jgi:hypothetical protein